MNELKLNVLHVGEHVISQEFIDEINGSLDARLDASVKLEMIHTDDGKNFPDYMVSCSGANDLQVNVSRIHEFITKQDIDVIILDNDAITIDQFDHLRFACEKITHDRARPIFIWLAVYDDKDKNPYKLPLRIQRILF